MRISTIGYVGKQGVKSIWRNKMFSLASIATMSACIFLFGLFFSILVNFQYIIRSAEEGVAITVFFDEEATDEQIQKIGEELKARDDVSEVKYISAEQAWENFKDKYFQGSDGRISRRIILEITRSLQKDLKMTIRWPIQITMKFI